MRTQVRAIGVLSWMSALLLLAGCPSAEPVDSRPLSWDMDVRGASEALKRAGMSPRYDENRAYFADPGAPIVHTSEPVLFYVPRRGWTGEAQFDSRHSLNEITLRAELSSAELRAQLAALARRLGPPERKEGERQSWVLPGSRLSTSATEDARTRRWTLLMSYRRDEPAAPR
jgi:hypothetical protein